ncbi:hypothetical protein ACJ72_04255 [Emergomyces africanus]|uniref:NmrA-like domain-containing protein n=1 Tax=Emergomyces africanus TaxID=1955775 RepID=A0A1B7NX97_9EURO|nr:hypothetical protein ACJ72_04255 [Emergomyces africanus]
MRATQTQKIDVMRHLEDKVVETGGQFSWTAIAVGNFFDWSIKRFPAFGFDIPNQAARIYDSGNEPFTGVLIDSIGQAVVGTFLNPAATANKFIRIRSLQTTQNQILRAVEQITESKWVVERISMEELYRAGNEKMEKGKEVFADGGDRSVVVTREDSDNALVGVQDVELHEVIRVL